MAFMSPFAVLFIYVWDSGTVKYDKKLTVGGEPIRQQVQEGLKG